MKASKVDSWLFNRWSALAAAILMEACGGLGYTFALYSQHIKERMHYNQEDLDRLGAAKDFGYCLGIIGGIVYNYVPPWLTITIGAVLHFSGYSMLWMTTSGQISPPGWMLCIFIGIGVGGDSWIDAAAIMNSLQNFEKFRGTTMGVLKAQVGLSGAIFVTLYKAFLKPNVDAYIFLVAATPSLAGIAVAILVRPYPCDDVLDAKDKSISNRFNLAYGATILLGLYLLISVLVQTFKELGRPLLMFFAVTMLLNFLVICCLLVLYSPFCSFQKRWADDERKYHSSVEDFDLPVGKPGDSNLVADERALDTERQPLKEAEVGGDRSKESEICVTSDDLVQKRSYQPFEVQFGPGAHERDLIGVQKELDVRAKVERLTLWSNVKDFDFWCICFVVILGPGTGLAVINNFGQISRALGSESVELFVGLISVASCFGRLFAGYGSDVMLRRTAKPRPVCLSMAHIVMAVGCFILSLGNVTLLYFGSFLVGGSYGAFWSLTPVIISEVFGLHNFAALYKLIGACAPVGAYVLSEKVVGYMYDEEAESYAAREQRGVESADENLCFGTRCFGMSMKVLASVCLVGACVGVLLAKRTTKIYAQLKLAATSA